MITWLHGHVIDQKYCMYFPLPQCIGQPNLGGWLHKTRAFFHKVTRSFNYLVFQGHVTTWMLHLHNHNDHSHQNWWSSYIQWGGSFHEVTRSLDHVVLQDHLTNKGMLSGYVTLLGVGAQSILLRTITKKQRGREYKLYCYVVVLKKTRLQNVED